MIAERPINILKAAEVNNKWGTSELWHRWEIYRNPVGGYTKLHFSGVGERGRCLYVTGPARSAIYTSHFSRVMNKTSFNCQLGFFFYFDIIGRSGAVLRKTSRRQNSITAGPSSVFLSSIIKIILYNQITLISADNVWFSGAYQEKVTLKVFCEKSGPSVRLTPTVMSEHAHKQWRIHSSLAKSFLTIVNLW